jgi:phospholipase C
LPITTNPRQGATFKYGPFRTSGPRVPAYLISPFVKAGSVYKGNLDHTSVLKCLAKRFGNGSYSPDVDPRPVGDIWDALELESPRNDDADFPPPPNVVGFTPNSTPTEPIPLAFQDAAAKAKAAAPGAAQTKFPELFSHFEDI